MTPAKVIAITSGKGGVGKTNIAINLSLALIRQGQKVLLLDADLGLANVNVMLGFEPKANISELMNGQKSLDQVIVHHSSGLDIIPASSGISELTNLSEAERLRLIEAVDEMAADYDYLIVDTAAGIGDNVLYFNTAAEEIIVVVDPQPTSLTDAYAVMKVLTTKCGVKQFSILCNRVPRGDDGRSVFAKISQPVAKFLSAKLTFLGAIQEDPSIPECVINQRPWVEEFPSSRASLDIQKIAQKIAKNQSERTTRGGLQFFFRAITEAQRGQ